MFIAKQEVIKQFLAFVTSFTPFAGMRLATLGGEGLEAALWQQMGIAPDRGWLIECVQKRSRRLVARFPYPHCARLEHFREAAQRVWGSTYGIDGFHLDLCGTYERGGAAFEPVIPLIMRSHGKCLAVTVADQRRNTTLERFDEVFSDACPVFGGEARARAFLETLRRDYEALPSYGVGLHADPGNGAEREFGFAYHLLRALAHAKALPLHRIERYLYLSNGKGRPFRMRTYFFHFADAAAPTDALALWSDAPLQQMTERGVMTIQRKEIMVAYPRLRALAEAAGGASLTEFNSLIADAVYGRQVRAVPYGNGAAHAQQITVAPSAAGASGRRSRQDAQAPAPTVTVKNRATLEAQLDLLRGNAKGKRAFTAAKKRATQALNLGQKNERAIGGVLARTQGKFRPGFLKGLAAMGIFDEKLVEELVGLYGAYGVEITAQELMTEAQAS